MLALAQATGDFDSLYRHLNGESVIVSTLLKEKGEKLGKEAIKSIIDTLTSALDGTYENEEQAVKTAVLKAVNILNK